MLVGGVFAGLPAAEGGDLDRLRPGKHVHQAEAPADDERAPEQRLHLFGCGVGREIEVLGLESEQQVADGAAHDERLEARLLQLPRYVDRAARDLSTADAMGIGAEHPRLGCRPARNQASEEATNHPSCTGATRLSALQWCDSLA